MMTELDLTVTNTWMNADTENESFLRGPVGQTQKTR